MRSRAAPRTRAGTHCAAWLTVGSATAALNGPEDCIREMRETYRKRRDALVESFGRAGWDNWMIYAGRRSGWPVVDATASIMIIHQNHDYSHLPGGQPHYRLPETDENVRLAGGKRVIFHLREGG